MGIMLRNEGGGDYEKPPEGYHLGVCVDVVDLGICTVEWQGEKKQQHKCRIVWELDPNAVGLTTKDQRFTISRRYTVSMHEKATLRHDLRSWRGRDFTDEELGGFDLDNIIGAPARLFIEHQPSRDGTIYANVTKVTKAEKSDKLTPSGEYTRAQDRDSTQSTEQENEPFPMDDDQIPPDDESVPF